MAWYKNKRSIAAVHDELGLAPVSGRRDDPAILVDGPIASTLLLFSLPILATNVLQSLNASINAAWIGHLLGTEALSASANANALLFMLLSACFGLGIMASILVALSLGARDIDHAKRVIGTVSVFFAAVALVMAILGVIAAPTILQLIQTPPDSLPLAAAYLRVIFVALPGMYLYSLLTMILRGAGDSRTPFAFMLVSALLDVGLNPLFILGVGPFPRLGIAGSALATLISQWATLVALIVWLYRSDNPLCLRGAELGYLRIDPHILKTLIAKGIPVSLQVIVMSFSLIMMISLVDRYGSETVAAYGACFQLWNYIQMPAFAVGSACSSMAAQNIGAARWDRVDRIAMIGTGYNILLTGILIVAVTLVDREAFMFFLGRNPGAIEIARHIHDIVSWSFVLFGISFVLSSVVRAAGAVIAPLLIMIIAFVCLRVPAAIALTPLLGADAVYWAFPIGSGTSLLMTAAYYRFGGWRSNRPIEELATPAPADVLAAPANGPA